MAVLNLVCALGLILSGLLGMPPCLTPLYAATLAVFLLVSLLCHIRFREKPVIVADIVLFLLAAFVAWGRWFLSPFFFSIPF